jgi:hypothetical protein
VTATILQPLRLNTTAAISTLLANCDTEERRKVRWQVCDGSHLLPLLMLELIESNINITRPHAQDLPHHQIIKVIHQHYTVLLHQNLLQHLLLLLV